MRGLHQKRTKRTFYSRLVSFDRRMNNEPFQILVYHRNVCT